MLKARKSKRWISILVAMVFLFSLLPAAAFADTVNRVSGATPVPSDAKEAPIGILTMLEDSDYKEDLQAGASFTVTFPSGVKLVESETIVEYVYDYDDNGTWTTLDSWRQSGDYTLDITMPSGFTEIARDGIRIKPVVNISGFDGGDIEVVVDGMGSGITSGKYVLGYVAEGDTTTTVLSVPTIGEVGKGGIIRIAENAPNVIKTGEKITIKLPKGFKWDTTTKDSNSNPYFKVDFLAGLSGYTEENVSGDGERTLTITLDNLQGTRTQKGIIQITPYIVAGRDAKYGDIEVELSGDDVGDADLVIANYADFDVTVKADGDVKEVLAGQIDAKLTKLQFKEDVAGSLLHGRKVRITLPEWIKIVKVTTSGVKQINLQDSDFKNGVIDDNEVEFVIDTDGKSGKVEFKLEFTVSIEANASGDIVAEVSGRAGAEGEVVIGEALAPVEVTSSSLANVSIGKKSQPVANITITEAKKGALMEDKNLIVSLPDGIKFAGTPNVKVTEGNLDLGSKIDANGSELTIPIKSESSKPSTIEITGIEVNLDRTIPSGEVKASIKGKALVENYEKDYNKYYTSGDDEGKVTEDYLNSFDTSTVAKVAVATVVAPGEKTMSASFVIGESTYVVDGVEYPMDVAPYLTAAGRTYVPVRYLAYALGVNEDNVYWDAASKTVTLLKGAISVQLTIDSNVYRVNDNNLPMDVAPEVKDGRTMLPARFVAQAFGASVGYDSVTQTVTIDINE